MNPVLFEWGPISIYSFGMMMAIAFLVAGGLIGQELRRYGLHDKLKAEKLVFNVLIGSLVGAKAGYIIENFQTFLSEPWSSLFSGGGLVWYEGFLGGFLSVVCTAWRSKIPLLKISDIMAPALALGYAIGRIGCLLAGDGDYGKPTNLPWAMSFPNGIVPTTDRVHPTPVYEAMLMTTAFLVLWNLRKKIHPAGFIFGLYLVLASLERFFVEFLRLNPVVAFHMTTAQFISILTLCLGITLLLSCQKKVSTAAL